MEAALREIRVALLEADVHFRVVKQFIEAIKEKAQGEEVLAALSPTQQVIKIVRDELMKTRGSHQSKLRMANEPPTAMLTVGLQGSAPRQWSARMEYCLRRTKRRRCPRSRSRFAAQAKAGDSVSWVSHPASLAWSASVGVISAFRLADEVPGAGNQ